HPGSRACRSVQTTPDTIRTESKSGLWAWEWRFSDSSAELTILKADPAREYWFLYEGTPGGRYEPGEQYWGTDLGGPRFDKPDYLAGEEGYGEWKWAYFGEFRSDRVLFVLCRNPEPAVSEMGYLGSDRSGLEAGNGMVVFGFGREKGAIPVLKGKKSFIVGFYPEKLETPEDHAEFKAYLDLFLNPGSSTAGH
ncbi:MAG: hypothetical protein KAH12_10115, partial [Anaerolineales bacterium]|nr:hypothetical protein [Anaerolineales bacterium]